MTVMRFIAPAVICAAFATPVSGSLLLQVAAQASAQTPNPLWEKSISLCGVSFKAGADWVAELDSEPRVDGRCQGWLKHKRYEVLVDPDAPGHFWMVNIEVMPRTFESVMDLYEVRRDGDRWFVGEGAREAPAHEIRGPGWWGLRVDELSIRSGPRSPRDDGPRSFESEAVWVIISNTANTQTATFLVGAGADAEVLPLLLNTIRFDHKR